jgi:hypothetical protein
VILYDHSAQVLSDVSTSAEALFDYMDDHTRIGSHMREPSMMMMPGGRMIYELDARAGRATGSVIKMHGSFLGLPLAVEEVIAVRPVSKPGGRSVEHVFSLSALTKSDSKSRPQKGFADCKFSSTTTIQAPSLAS